MARRSLARLIACLLCLMALVALLLLAYRQAVLPKISGQLTLKGLSAPVDVVRDAAGVPHIFASQAGDAWFALGFVHAQDRLWQMSFNRRIESGRLAEILGAKALATDRYLRTLGVRRNAEAQWLQQDAATRATLQRYADGVNAYLQQRSGPLPVEFIVTGSPPPEPWTPVDSLAWVTMMAWDLSGNAKTELLRMRLAARLSQKQIDQLLPPYPGDHGVADAVLPSADYTQLYRHLSELAGALAKASQAAPDGVTEGKGSNNWVVSGARTQSGKPLLANDPHLALAAPSLWYLAALTAPGLNVIGATLPGLPGVALGHNDHIAWGATNTGPDTQDLYIEQIQGDRVRTPAGWQPLTVRSERIAVKGAADDVLTVRSSRHGPLLSDVAGNVQDGLNSLAQPGFALAFQWVALSADDGTLGAFLKLDQATTWSEFLAAFANYRSPQQNFVYADVQGNIGYFAPGRIPLRSAANDLHGLAPAPGWDARYDWSGFVPAEQLPMRFNPSEGKIVTANQKVVGPDNRPFLTTEWMAPFRARRIDQLLDAKAKHSSASFAHLQADQTSLAAQELLPLLLNTAPSSPAAADALKRLSAWDGEMSAARIEPTIYHSWLRQLVRLVVEDKLGRPLFGETWAERPVFLTHVLRNDEGQADWCDDTRTSQRETCAQLKSQALDLALADLARRYGTDPRHWMWGDVHQAVSSHQPLSAVPWLAPWFNLSVPVGGDAETIDVAQFRPADEAHPFRVFHAPSLRAIYDLSDLDGSLFIQSTGQSGLLGSPLYANFLQRWAQVEYLPMSLDRRSAEQQAQGILHLTPDTDHSQ